MSFVKIANYIRQKNGYKFPRLGRFAFDSFFSLMPETFDAVLFDQIIVPLKKNDLTQRTTYWQGARFEYPTAEILRSWITLDTTDFFDIGANYGFFSYWMQSCSSAIRVHSFEPNPMTFALINKIIARNNLRRQTAWNIGLSNERATLSLNPGVEDSGHTTFGKNPELHSQPIANVEVVSFDDWIEQTNLVLPMHPAWIAKIDVEGYELKVLQGMESILRAKVFQGLVVEINPFTLNFCKSSVEEVIYFLEHCGYKRIPPFDHGNSFWVPQIN